MEKTSETFESSLTTFNENLITLANNKKEVSNKPLSRIARVFNRSVAERNYKSDEKARIRVYSIERYPAKSFATSSVTSMSTKYMPATSYYSIVDSHTGDVIIPFNTSYTKLSCDTTSNYFDL